MLRKLSWHTYDATRWRNGRKKKNCWCSKTVPGVKPDKSGVLFKISVHNEEGMKKFVIGQNPVGKPIYDEYVENIQVWKLSQLSFNF